MTKDNPYGYCPICGSPGKIRERRPDGDDLCKIGHRYKSSYAVSYKEACMIIRQYSAISDRKQSSSFDV